MLDLQLKWFAAMAEMSMALSDQMLEAAKCCQPVAEQSTPAAAKDRPNAMALPELPAQGRSWYRAPVENPVLAFWDTMLRPWRTHTSAAGMPMMGAAFGAWPGSGPHNALSSPMMLNDAFAPMFAAWQDMGRAMTDGGATTNSHPAKGPRTAATSEDEAWKSMVAYHSDAGMAVARVFFPDHTTVSVEVPVPNSMFPTFKPGF